MSGSTMTHRSRTVLDAVGRAYPDAWRSIEQKRKRLILSGRGDWPSCCYAPLECITPLATANGSFLPIIPCSWRWA